MSVQVQIFTRNMELTERIEEFVTKKASKLQRYIADLNEIRVDLTQAKTVRSISDRNVAQITVWVGGTVLRSEERSEDIFVAFDEALDKMQRQIARFKGKRDRGRGDGRTAAEVIELPVEEIEPEEELVVARRKRFTLIPMSEVEAIDQMKLVGHENFFVFYNADSHAVNVLYRRRDGTYGLIETEVG